MVDAFDQLRSDNWTDDGIEHVRKFMREHNIADPLEAAKIIEASSGPPIDTDEKMEAFMDRTAPGWRDFQNA